MTTPFRPGQGNDPGAEPTVAFSASDTTGNAPPDSSAGTPGAPAPGPPLPGPPVGGVLSRIAAICSIGAAAIHFGVTGEHFGAWWVYGVFFLAAAAFQVGWGVLAWQRATPALLVAGAGANAVLVLLWLETRTLGLPFGPEAGHAEPFGAADLLCALFETIVIGLGVLGVLTNGLAARVRTRTGTAISVAAAAAVIASAGLALAAPAESHSAADHAAGHAADDEQAAAGGTTKGGHSGHSGHQDGTGNGERHDMSNLPDASSATDDQTRAATELVDRTIAETAKYRNADAALAAGYDLKSAIARFEKKHPKRDASKPIKTLHVPNPKPKNDQKVLDPTAPETLLFRQKEDKSWMLVGVMYVAGKGNQPPTIGAPYARWHFHEGCRDGNQKVKKNSDGKCPAGSKQVASGYMMHVWFVQHQTPAQLAYAYALDAPGPQLLAYQKTVR